jgi:P pilus assembly chaperone PapD
MAIGRRKSVTQEPKKERRPVLVTPETVKLPPKMKPFTSIP